MSENVNDDKVVFKFPRTNHLLALSPSIGLHVICKQHVGESDFAFCCAENKL